MGRLDPNQVVKLNGNVHPYAVPGNDQGRVSPNLLLDYVTLRFKPTPGAAQADLDQLLRDLQNPTSPLYRKWLTPEQYADRFGASKADIAQVVAWLEGRGLTVVKRARGRNFVVFKGPAGLVEEALHTEIHHFLAKGEVHWANVTEPSVPSAIHPFTIGFSGLDDFKPEPPPHARKPVPAISYNGQNALGPGDLWLIYHIASLQPVQYYWERNESGGCRSDRRRPLGCRYLSKCIWPSREHSHQSPGRPAAATQALRPAITENRSSILSCEMQSSGMLKFCSCILQTS